MKSLKILALGISLLVMATNCKLSEQEIASDDVKECGPDPAASSVTQRQCKQEQGNGRRSDGNGAADVRQQPPQCNDFRPE